MGATFVKQLEEDTLCPPAMRPAPLPPQPCGCRADPPARCCAALRVASMNTPTSGDHFLRDSWAYRAAATAQVLARQAPDLVCLQEPHEDQARQVHRTLGETAYGMFGRGRDADGKDEFQPILWREEALQFVRGGTFWLGDDTQAAGKLAWDAACTRHCNWVELRRRASPEVPVFVFNTHWDHVGAEARAKSGELIASQIHLIAGDSSCVVVAGDMNCTWQSPGMRALVSGARLSGSGGQCATYVGWESSRSAAIDFVLWRGFCEGSWCAVDAATMQSGRHVSDHLPIVCLLHFQGDASGDGADEDDEDLQLALAMSMSLGAQ
eukprot:m51a1_g4006 hypothetical protein (323) ;mRNA; f:548097-549137